MLRIAFEINDKRVYEQPVSTNRIFNTTDNFLPGAADVAIIDSGIEHILYTDGSSAMNTLPTLCQIADQTGLFDGITSVVISSSYTLAMPSLIDGYDYASVTTTVVANTDLTIEDHVVAFETIIKDRHKVIISDGVASALGEANEVWV